jgi:transketolase
VDADNPAWDGRDYFVLSAGHKCLALYGALVELGFEAPEVMDTYNQMDTPIPGHPDADKFRGVDVSTGSLGHGLAIACGLAKGWKLRGRDNKVYVLMGDGEQGEGSVWESASVAAHHGLDNIVAIIDKNRLQINGTTEQVQQTDQLKTRYESFGWDVETVNGHEIDSIYAALTCPGQSDKPRLIIAETIKGKGLSFAENNVNYHHWNPKDPEEIKRAMADLGRLEKEALQ